MKNIKDEQKAAFVVSGYVFTDEETAKKAEKEIAGVAYTRNKLDMDNPGAVLAVYNKIIRSKMFSTPVGYEYLTELRKYLKASPNVDDGEILEIDFTPVIVRENTEKELKDTAGGDQIDRLRGGLVTSLIVNVILILAIIAMIVLVQKSDVPTILDYENKLIDRYEEWQKSLEEREAIIREYEIKYNINNGFNAQ